VNLIFIDSHFPGRLGLLAQMSGRDKNNKTVFITSADHKNSRQIPGVKTLFFDHTSKDGHKEIRGGFNRPGLGVAQILVDVEKRHPVPDLILGHCGPGTTFYVKDVFPDTPFLGFFDWYHRPGHLHGKHFQADGSDVTHRMDIRHRNLFVLSDLCACDQGICPTAWQKKQFPDVFLNKLNVVHPGIDTRAFHPKKDPVFKTGTLDLSGADHLITSTGHALNSNPGFGQFTASLRTVLKRKPKAHIVIAGPDTFFPGTPSGDKPSQICKQMGLNPEQVHFLEGLDQDRYIQLLQASSVHVSIDSEQMVSTAMLQAMSCECLVMAPDIPSVREIITDGTNGLIVDFSTPDKISQKILTCLDYPSFMTTLKEKARQTIMDKYAFEKTLPRHLDIIRNIVTQKKPEPFG
jgi:glycosyltransferase involved in cell wall biosynthesis